MQGTLFGSLFGFLLLLFTTILTNVPVYLSSRAMDIGNKDPTEVLHKLLGERIKCTLNDGRSATGRFICVDRLMNLILTDVAEERIISTSDYSDSKDEKIPAVRMLGQALIPGERLAKVEIERSVFETKLNATE